MPEPYAPTLITHPAQLSVMLRHLREQMSVAVDTESDSLYVYHEKVCLIQISIPDFDYLIDPLVPIDLQPLKALFADPHIQKVFHAAEYDVMCLRRDYAFTFNNLFDTMWAARILGWPRVGLGDILQEHFSITLDKRWQRHNWGKRPIEPEALAYARYDTHYLLRLRDTQLKELRQLDRLEEAEEVFADLAQSEYNGRTFQPDQFWHVKGVYDLSGRSQAILRQLVILREHEAQRQNRPPFKVIGDKTLLAIAARAPHRLDQLKSITGLTPLLIQRYGHAIVEAITHAQHDPIPTPPKRMAPDPAVIDRYEKLRAWRKQVAAQRGVEPDVIVGNAVLMDIARRRPRTLHDLPATEWFGPWRKRVYGPAILNVIAD